MLGALLCHAVADDWTVRRVLSWTAEDFAGRGLDSPRLDAELLVARALGTSRVALYLDLDRPLAAEELARIRSLVARRRRREPIAYILGEREFYGRSFECGPATLVPRPDTETLVAQALDELPDSADGPVVDLCTGSGAVGLTLLAERGGLRGELTDLSEAALETTRRNAARLGVEARMTLHRGDLFDAFPARLRVPLIVANPPYVPDRELAGLMPEVAVHEPRLALAGGVDGLEVVRRILDGAGDWLLPGGKLLMEVGEGQAAEVRRIAETLPAERQLVWERAARDLGGVDRVVVLRSTLSAEAHEAEERAASERRAATEAAQEAEPPESF